LDFNESGKKQGKKALLLLPDVTWNLLMSQFIRVDAFTDNLTLRCEILGKAFPNEENRFPQQAAKYIFYL